MQTRFNQRLTTTDMRVLNEPLGELFDEQTTAFKVNLGYGFILMEKQSGRFKYYHSSSNCCGRYREEPALITNRADFDSFLKRIHESDILQWAITQRQNSDWVCVLVTNVTFFVNRILQHPIGCVVINLPTYVKRNKAVIGLEKDPHGAVYRDNLCLFRCLVLHLRREAAALYAEYSCRPRVNGLARVDERGACFVVVPIKYSVGVRHALIAPQSYDVRVHVYTYSKVVTRRDL